MYAGNGFEGQTDWDHTQILMAIAKTQFVQELNDKPVMHPYRAWSAKLVAALKHYLDHLKDLAVGDDKWTPKDIQLLVKLKEGQLNRWGKRAKKCAKLARLAKNFLTSQQLAMFPDTEVLQFAIEQAMLVLDRVVERALKKQSISAGEHALLNKCLTLILGGNGFLGRSGEWKKIIAKTIEELSQAHENVIVCEQHKTSVHYGELAKYIFTGVLLFLIW